MPLKGKVALVTGGTRGIGKAIATELACRGADIVVSYLRNHEAARQTVAEMESLGVKVQRIQTHLGDAEDIRRMFAEIRSAFGRLDILVNNAASGVLRTALELEEKHWDWTMDVNARGAWLCAKEAVKLMEGGGRIVNITSMGSQRVLDYYTAVGVSKAALEALTRYLAVELAPRNIIVNAVAGGLVETDALNHFPNREQMQTMARRSVLGGRTLTPQDIAHVVAFLCDEGSEMIRGQTIVVDGGACLR